LLDRISATNPKRITGWLCTISTRAFFRETMMPLLCKK
jgi:hypothetical protein